MKLSIDAVGINIGGGITILNNILYYLTKIDKSLNIEVYIEEGVPSNIYIYSNININIKTIKKKSVVKRIVWQQFIFHSKAISSKADVVLSITNIVSFFPKIPQVVYFHQSLLFAPNKQLFKFFNFYSIIRFKVLKFFVIMGFFKSNAIVTQTDLVRQSIIAQFPSMKDKIYQVYSGTPKVFQQNINTNDWSATFDIGEGFKILYIAYPTEYKNFDILFDAARLAKRKHIKFKFILTLDVTSSDPIQQGFINKYINKISEYKIEDYVYFMGSLKSNIEVERSYVLSDVVIHPSFVESFPQTFTEAMRYGKPLISADLPYAREIAGKSSLYFKPEDPVDLLNAIEKYINNENFMNEMSIKSKNRGDFFKPVLNWNKLYKIIKNSVQK